MEDGRYYIQDTRWLHGGNQPFFRTRDGGYSGVLSEAGLFSQEEAIAIINPMVHIIWPERIVLRAARLEVNLQALYKVAAQDQQERMNQPIST